MAKAITKAGERIEKPVDVKLNVLPIFGSLIHLYAYEGPCRFGGAEELTNEFDSNAAAAGFKAFKEKLAALYGDDADVNILDAVHIPVSDEFYYHPSVFDELTERMADVDVIFAYGNPMPRLCRELNSRYHKPFLILTNSGAITTTVMSDLICDGYEDVYGAIDWKEVTRYFHAMKAVKALSRTRVLKMIRHESDAYLTADFFINNDVLRNKFGVQSTSINMHEMMDQLHNGDGTGNYTLPIRDVYNLNDEDEAEAEAITKGLIADADECWMDEDKVLKSVRFNVLTRKLMDHFGCNAFTAQCKECCATTRINQEQITYCLGHSLNNECGIASACEGDINALCSITLLSSLSHKAPYMSNTTPLILDENGEIVSKNWFGDAPCVSEYPNELYCTWHAVPNRFMQGYDSEQAHYGVGPFASNARFGATIRYKFEEDAGKEITLMRFNPRGTKMLIVKGTIVGGTGYDRYGCPEGVYFRVSDRDKLFKAQLEFGNHLPLVYGDYVNDLEHVAELLGVEPVVFQ